LPWLIRRHHLDILHVQRIAPLACGSCRVLLTVHDLIPIKYPSSYAGLRNKLIRLMTPSSLARADLIACPSQFVCDQIRECHPTVTSPKRPFYNGVDPRIFAEPKSLPAREIPSRYSIERPYIFSPGAIEERKNVHTIIEAMAQLDSGSRPLLILCGSIRDKAYFARLNRLARELNIAECIRHLGFVSEEDLVHLYGRASLCIAASREEGFNLLPLEAMACGAPVLCSDIPVHRELYEGATTFFPPDSPDLLAQAILGVRANKDRDRGSHDETVRTILRRMSWEAMAHRMAKCFEELSEGKPKTKKSNGGRLVFQRTGVTTKSNA
jgi:glycosyltransferase involved in cell wall biosynthesis